MLASGITTVQVVANPLISLLGPARTASSRLTFAQAFNSLGTTLFPYVGSILILGSLATVDPNNSVGRPLLDAFAPRRDSGGGAYLYRTRHCAGACWPAVVWLQRKRLVEDARGADSPSCAHSIC